MADCSAAFYEATIKEFGPSMNHLKLLRGFLLVNIYTRKDVLSIVSTMAQTGRQTKALKLLIRASHYYLLCCNKSYFKPNSYLLLR